MNFSMWSCSHSLPTKKAEHHVEESSGKKDRRRACGGEIETDERNDNFSERFGCFEQPGELVIKKFERESISHVRFGYIIQPGDYRLGRNSDLKLEKPQVVVVFPHVEEDSRTDRTQFSRVKVATGNYPCVVILYCSFLTLKDW